MQDVGIAEFYIQYRTLIKQELNNKLNFKFDSVRVGYAREVLSLPR